MADYRQQYGKPTQLTFGPLNRDWDLSVTIHYQTDKSFESKVMDCKYIHSAENIGKCYGEKIGQYGMNHEDFFWTMSDNATNMKKAFKVSSFHWQEVFAPHLELKLDLISYLL